MVSEWAGPRLRGTHSGDQASPEQEGLWTKTSYTSRGHSLSREKLETKRKFTRVECCSVRSEFSESRKLTKGKKT